MIGYRLYSAPSASIKATVNGEMSVACPATRRDGRRRLRLRNEEAKVRNFKLQTAKVKVFKLRKWKSSGLSLQASNLKLRKCEGENLQTWVFKLRKWKSSSLSLQASIFRLRKWESSNLKLQSWGLGVGASGYESEGLQGWGPRVFSFWVSIGCRF